MKESEVHSLLRNSIPGTIFLLCVLSIILSLGDRESSLSSLIKFESILGLLFSSLPFGAVFQSIYRATWYKPYDEEWIVAAERAAIRRREANETRFSDREVLSIVNLDLMKKPKLHDWFVLHFSQIHSYGASAIAILFALPAGIVISALNSSHACPKDVPHLLLILLVGTFWVASFGAVYTLRETAIEQTLASIKILGITRKRQLDEVPDPGTSGG